MKHLLFIAVALMLFVGHSQASDVHYKIDDQQLDHLFSSAQEVSLADLPKMYESSPNPAVATILSMPWLGVGMLGIHRLYLGTETSTFLAYLFTLGGCGVISLVDFVVLAVGLVNDDVSQYVDNPKFIMWAN